MRKSDRRRIGGLFVLALLLAAAQVALAQQRTPPANVAHRAEEVVREVSEYLGGLDSFSVDAVLAIEIEGEGAKLELKTAYAFAMQRPDRVSLVLKSGLAGTTVVCDGSNVYRYIPLANRYWVDAAPDTLEGILQTDVAGGLNLGLGEMQFFDAFLHREPYELMMEGVNAGTYKEQEQLDGVMCHRMGFMQQDFEWEMWVEVGEKPLVRKVAVDLSRMLGRVTEAMPGLKGLKGRMTFSFTDWSVDEPLAESRFQFTPPEGAIKLDLPQLSARGRKAHPLLGKPAPDFKLPLLEGGHAELAPHRGKDIVILDFWASWCGPCKVALPILVEVSKEYSDKGVVFYAVNLREEPKTVYRFLKEQELQCPVALDKDGKVGRLYNVTGIPQSVIIDKDGTVQVVHAGFSREFKQRLTAELDALLAGKNLAPATAGREGQ